MTHSVDQVDGDPKPCPQCGYDMQGLPDVYACPECTFDYDPHAVVISLGYRSRVTAPLVAIAILTILWSYNPASVPAEPPGAFRGLVYLMICCVIWYAVRVRRHSGKNHRIVISRHGMEFDDPDHPPITISWGKIKRARYSWTNGHVYLYDHAGRKEDLGSFKLFGSPRTARRCVREINRLRDVYR